MKKYILVLACSVLLAGTVDAQVGITYSRGQDVSPTYEGWEQNPDGSYTMHFGYFNRNIAEDVGVPIGADNNFDPGGDQGQPTHFYTGRRWWVFKVVVPKDWPKDRRLVWTLTTNGKTNQAKGWLQPEWEIDKGVIFKNASRDPTLMTAGTNERDYDKENEAPAVKFSAIQPLKVSDTLTITATATDDGRPKPLGEEGPPEGVRMRWILYRGPANVRFDPEVTRDRVYGKPATLQTNVKFTQPGAYKLRVIASDGELFSTHDVDVTVSP
jgi:hypothetical protein